MDNSRRASQAGKFHFEKKRKRESDSSFDGADGRHPFRGQKASSRRDSDARGSFESRRTARGDSETDLSRQGHANGIQDRHEKHNERHGIGSDQRGQDSHQLHGQQDKSRQSHTPDSLKEKAARLQPIRKELPIWSHTRDIRSALREKDVLLLVGETGSGKSTQVPQMLLYEPWCRPKTVQTSTSHQTDKAAVGATLNVQVKASPAHVNGGSHHQQSMSGANTITVGGCIAITQPRRVAAVTLAKRVAEEMGTPCGSAASPGSRVGYSVRFDHNAGPNTQVKFLTEGMLLREMVRDPWLKAYSAVVVDEVHERGVDVDLVLGFLKRLLSMPKKDNGRGGVPLKVIIMSATARMDKLAEFLEGEEVPGDGATKEVPTSSPGVNGLGKHDESTTQEYEEWSGFSSSGESTSEITSRDKRAMDKTATVNGDHSHAITKHLTSETSQNAHNKSQVSICHIEGRQFPVKVMYLPEPTADFVDAALQTIIQIHRKESLPGDILIFVTGQESVETLESLTRDYGATLGPDLPRLLVLPLFAALPQAAQQKVFQPTPPRTRKVIISTNIAETSVTVSGVRFVIDCGKAKVKQYRSRIGLESLLVKPISKSAAIQRKGRAGREGPGICHRLYTEQEYLALADYNTPEILRCDLSHSILTMKARGIADIHNFPFLDPPSREALYQALFQLTQLGALNGDGSISDVGRKMSTLPLSVSLSRALIASDRRGCTSQMIDIVSCLSVENIFSNILNEEKKEEAETTRRELVRREGDHLTYLATVRGYDEERSDRKAWSTRRFINHRAMQAVMDVRKQLRELCSQMGMVGREAAHTVSDTETSTAILKALLEGFVLNTARLCPDGSYKTLFGNQTVAVHPSSGLFGRKVEAIVFNEFVYTNRSYARGVSAVQMDWIVEVMGSGE